MKRRTKGCLIAAGAFVGIALLAVAGLIMYAHHARRAWKEAALPEIARMAGDKDWVSGEIALLGGSGAAQNPRVIAPGWLSDSMILMKSGEWLVYRSHCSKQQPHRVKDIFLARGSDGQWYYSTCHFCMGMVALLMMQQEQPPDLAFFADRYHLREFDGKSDECLKETKTFPDNL